MSVWALKRGYTFDPECSRETHRMRVASTILRSLHVEPEWPEHAETCGRHRGEAAKLKEGAR
jgi:hypothetical protein